MKRKPLLVLKRGSASKYDIARLRRAGMLVIELEHLYDRSVDAGDALLKPTPIESLCFQIVMDLIRGDDCWLTKDKAAGKIAAHFLGIVPVKK